MKRILTLLASVATCVSISADDIRVSANINTDEIWTSDNTYILDSQVYVVGGASLTIEPGTVIKGAAKSESATALIITRGSKIYALGTPSQPIIFTAESDELNGNLDEGDTQLWGGLIVLGAAPLNSANAGTIGDPDANPAVPTIDNIEGLQNLEDNDWTEYGGSDEHDNSGIIRYVSIRHGGSVIGSDNEINGLTMGGVGDGTIIEFVEVFANKDDGFEWFGGTVNARYLVAAFGNDDSFDYDLGWTGKGQFWFSLGTSGATTDAQDHAGEHDGTKDASVDFGPRGLGTVYNATYVGPGSTTGDQGVFEVSDDAGVRYYNSIFAEWGGHGVDVLDDALQGLTVVEDGVTRVDFRNNIWWGIGGDTAALTLANLSLQPEVIDFLMADEMGNSVVDPMFRGISRTAEGELDPRPAAGSPAFSNARAAYPAGDSWYIPVSYQGAFGGSNWMYGWTKLSQDGYLRQAAERTDGAIYNTAVRTTLDIPDGELVALGLVITGDAPRMVLVRADGPNTSAQGVSNPASATAMQVFNALTGEPVTDVLLGWIDSEQAAAIEVLSAHVGFPDVGDDTTSSMALLTLNPGNYSIGVSNPDGTGGEAVISATLIDR